MKNIAIISPNKNAYSETFIQAHRDLLNGNIHYLYGGAKPLFANDEIELFDYYIRSNVLNLLILLYYKITNRKTEWFYLEYYLKKNKIDVILAEYGTTAATNIQLIKKLKIPLIVHFHGFDASHKPTIDEYKNRYTEVFNYATKIIAVSNVMSDKLMELGCHANKLLVNRYGPNNLFFGVQPTFTKKQFLAVGRFTDKKAPYYLVWSFSILVQKHPDVKLIIAGDGHLLESTKNIAKLLNIDKNVEFPGVISADQFKLYLSESIAFVQHSITTEQCDMEGTPVAVLEASAAGLPVISTYHAGIPDVIIDGETGFLVKEHDVEGMARNMIRVLDDIELAKKLGAIGKKRIEEYFTMDRHISTIQKLIDNE